MLIVNPELASVACAFLSIAPSEAAVERSFSHQGIVHSKKRFLLSDQSVSNELQIKLNGPLLESSSPRIGFYSEMTEQSDHDKPIKFGELALTKSLKHHSRAESKSNESHEGEEQEEIKQQCSESEEEGGESEAESSDSDDENSDSDDENSETEEASESNVDSSRQNRSVKPSYSMQPTRSFVPVAKKFIMKAKLKAPIKRWNDQLLVQLRGFMTEKAKRVQEVDLRREVARQLNIKYTQQNQPEPQQNQPEPQQNQPEPEQNQPEPPQQQE